MKKFYKKNLKSVNYDARLINCGVDEAENCTLFSVYGSNISRASNCTLRGEWSRLCNLKDCTVSVAYTDRDGFACKSEVENVASCRVEGARLSGKIEASLITKSAIEKCHAKESVIQDCAILIKSKFEKCALENVSVTDWRDIGYAHFTDCKVAIRDDNSHTKIIVGGTKSQINAPEAVEILLDFGFKKAIVSGEVWSILQIFEEDGHKYAVVDCGGKEILFDDFDRHYFKKNTQTLSDRVAEVANLNGAFAESYPRDEDVLQARSFAKKG